MNFYIEAMYQFFLQNYFFRWKNIFFVKEKNIFGKSKISMKNEKNPSVENEIFHWNFRFSRKYFFRRWKNIFHRKKIVWEKKLIHSFDVKIHKESIPGVFRAIGALLRPLERKYLLFSQFATELFPPSEMACHVQLQSYFPVVQGDTSNIQIQGEIADTVATH